MKRKAVIAFLFVFFAAAAFAQFNAVDPTRAIPNARVLGLGKAFIGLADDTGSIYSNPAGLTEAQNWQAASMSGKFLDEYDFLSFAGFYPTEYGVLGVGFAGASIAGAWATTIESSSDAEDPVYVIDQSQTQMGYQNNAYILSYANEMQKLAYLNRLPFSDRISLGLNFKIFNVRLYGDGIVNGDAQGNELDFGLKYHPVQKWMKFGLTAQNLLPISMGGKLTYASGHTESYPLVFKGGSVFNLLGRENSLFRYGEHNVKLMLDFDTHPTLANYPLAWHLASEWHPMEMVAVRAALDQDAGDDGAGNLTTYTDMAYGVGINMQGFCFDYAYHTFAGAPNVNNNYFSLSYGGNIFEAAPKDPILVKSPQDQFITPAAKVVLSGVLLDPTIQNLFVNGVKVKFALKGEFETEIDLKEGKNVILIEGKDKEGKPVAEKKIRVLRLMAFPDVPAGFWVAQPISMLSMQKIVAGYPDGSFRPGGDITRAEMCSLLMKAKFGALPAEAEVEFSDVEEAHWAAPYIALAAKEGIVKGYPDGSFRPKSNITRAEGVAMITRFAGVSDEVYAGEFPDLTEKHWAADIIAGAFEAGLVDYLRGMPFQVNKRLTRAETVEMLYRTQYVGDILSKDLLNWDAY